MDFYSKAIILTTFTIALLFQGCASPGSMKADGGDTYEKDLNSMVEVVERAIRGTSLSIEFAEKSKDGNKYTIIFSKRQNLNNQSVQQDQAQVIVEKVGENKTKVVIENPEYHFSVPEYQKEDYRRILKNRIDAILEKK